MILAKNKCNGCHACFNICPKKCIKMEYNNEGFLYPTIDKDICINCNLCKKVCPIIDNQYEKLFNNPSNEAYALKAFSNKLKMESSSGGAFSIIASKILMKNGVVYGAAYDENFLVKHIRVDNIKDLNKLRRSKYVQSCIGNTYSLAKEDLEKGVSVLFTGTACQIAGLKSFLRKEYNNLLCIDVICHGVPSPMVWNDYIKGLEKKEKAKIVDINFRDKIQSWIKFNITFTFNNGKIISEQVWNNSYMLGFLKDIYLRNSCYNCEFKNYEIKRVSDITMADYWGVDTEEIEFFDDKGVSLLLINSSKGKKVIENLNDSSECEIILTKIREALKYNIACYRSYRKPIARSIFFRNYKNECDFEKLLRKIIKEVDIENLLIKKLKSIKHKIIN